MIKLIQIVEQITTKKTPEQTKFDQKISKITLKNPKTGNKNKLTTAAQDKDNPNHSKAIDIIKKLRQELLDKKVSKNNPNIVYLDKVEGVLKNLKTNPKKIQEKLNKAKDKAEFKKIFRKEIDTDKVLIDDKTLDLFHKLWLKNKEKESPSITDKKVNKTKQTKQKVRKEKNNDFDDYDYSKNNRDYEQDEQEKEEIKDLHVHQVIGLLSVAGLFGGIEKVFSFSSNFTRKYLERFKEEFSEKSSQLKDLFNYED